MVSSSLIFLARIDSRTYTLNFYKNKDSENDDIPFEVTQLLPTLSTVRMDIMATLHKQSSDGNLTYLKAGQVYDDGDIHSKYLEEITEEESKKTSPQQIRTSQYYLTLLLKIFHYLYSHNSNTIGLYRIF